MKSPYELSGSELFALVDTSTPYVAGEDRVVEFSGPESTFYSSIVPKIKKSLRSYDKPVAVRSVMMSAKPRNRVTFMVAFTLQS